MGPNVRWCNQEKKSRVYLREEHSGQKQQIPEGRNVPVVTRCREEASVAGWSGVRRTKS